MPPTSSTAPGSALRLASFVERPDPSGRNDWLFVTPKDSKGWILDAICREIGSRLTGSWDVVYNPKILPEAGTYFFSHYWNYLDHLKRNPHIRNGRTLVWYTHPREIPYTLEEQLEGYRQAGQILFTCSEYRDLWMERGLPEERGVVTLGGADQAMFKGHARSGDGVVGLSSSFYERKNPDALLEIVRALPHRRFTLIGRKWDEYVRFSELIDLQNFTYVEAAYQDYPRHYATFDVFLSLAMLEGGPIPVLEAMMENVVPVASRTGFCPDLIRHGENGYLFDVGSPAAQIAPLIEAAFALHGDIRETVMPYSWDQFAAQIHKLGQPIPIAVAGATAVVASVPGLGNRLEESARQPFAEDVDVLCGLEAMRTFHRGNALDCERHFQALISTLSTAPVAPARVTTLVLEAGAKDDVLAAPAAGQIASLAPGHIYLVINAPDAVAVSRLQRWAAEAGVDGLMTIVEGDAGDACCSANRVSVRNGVLLDDVELASIANWLEHVGQPGAASSLTISRHETPHPLVVCSSSDEPAQQIDDARTEEFLIHGRIAVHAPRGSGVMVTDPERSTIFTRIAPIPGREAATHLPTRLVVKDPISVEAITSSQPGRFAHLAKAEIAPGDISPAALNVFANRGGAGNPVVRAFADAVGVKVSYACEARSRRTGVDVVWGVLRGSHEVIQDARRTGRSFFYIDHAYFGRGHYLNYRISRDSYEAGRVRRCPDDRRKLLGVELQPWRSGGLSIIVCPPTRFFMEAHDCPNWLEDTVATLLRASDRPIEIRGKPEAGEPSEPLENVFRRAHAVVTHSSNVAVEAAVAGVPVFVAPTSAAAHVGETDLSRIEIPRRPDRSEWLSHLTYSQFSFQEIRDGTAWRILRENETRELVI